MYIKGTGSIHYFGMLVSKCHKTPNESTNSPKEKKRVCETTITFFKRSIIPFI